MAPRLAVLLVALLAACGSKDEKACAQYKDVFLRTCTDTCAKSLDRDVCSTKCAEALPKDATYASKCQAAAASAAAAASSSPK
jgi:hypothetical protein